MDNRSASTDRFWSVVLGISVLAIGGLHYVIPDSQYMWHNLAQHLFVLPISLAALYFGWRGGLAATALALAIHLPQILSTDDRQPFEGYSLSESVELLEFSLAAVMIGILSDRERKQKRLLEQTTEKLSHVYRELQDNFERMKRSERLYALGQLSAGLAHEIRNPLASIEGAAGILHQHTISEGQRSEFLEIIGKECRRVNRLLTNFLEFASPRPPQCQFVSVRHLLESVIGLVAHSTGNNAVVLRKDLLAEMLEFEGDPEQLKQVILNLAINAIQAMPHGGEVVFLGRHRKGEILIQVRDHGCGVSQEYLDRIFDPFFTTKENGTGLGLSVAHQIVSQHGGVLTAENNRDKGMTFSILLPLRRGKVL